MDNNVFLEKLLQGASVEWKSLGDIACIKTGQSISKHIISHNPGIYPVINSGREPLGYINQWNTDNDPIGVTTRGAGVGSITWQEGKYFRGNLNYSVTIKNTEIVNVRYLYHVLMEFQKKIHELCTFTGIPALNASELKTLKIPIPPLSVQQEIVKILDTLTALNNELINELAKELTLRQKQYQYYRDMLLNFNQNDSRRGVNSLFGPVVIQWKMLREVAEYSKTRIQALELNQNNYVGVDNLLQNRAGKTISNYVPSTGNLTRFTHNDILIGNIRPYLKKIWYADCVGGTNGDVLVIRTTETAVNPRYLYQVLSDDKFFAYNMQNAKGAKMPRGNKSAVLQYPIPIPPIEEQKRIVEILDKFDTLTNSISEGLPKEIELRNKQYEYYREMLLGFERV